MTKIHDPFKVGYCPRCAEDDHTNHHPALGGICIGCACPVTSDEGGES